MALFTKDFQSKILCLFLNDQSIFSKYFQIIESYFFENPLAKQIYELTADFYRKYKIIPDKISLIQECNNYFIGNANTEFTQTELVSYAENIYSIQIEDQKYIEDTLISFSKNQAFKSFILECSDNITGQGVSLDSLNKMRGKMDEVIRLGDSLNDIGHIYFDKEAIEERIKIRKAGMRSTAIPTGNPYLDFCLEGGLCKGELGILLAPANRGKTIGLVNFGVGAILSNYVVFHYYMEGRVGAIENRYDACLMRENIKLLNSKDDAVRKKMQEIYNTYHKHLIIKRLSYQKSTVLDIMNHIALVEKSLKIKPDLVLVDYGDVMSPAYGVYKEERHRQHAIFKELAFILAAEAQVAVWSGSQSNRASADKETVKDTDAGEDYGKIQISDITVTHSQTEEEIKCVPPRARYYLAKMRDGEKNKMIYLNMNLKNEMRIDWDMFLQAEKDPNGVEAFEASQKKIENLNISSGISKAIKGGRKLGGRTNFTSEINISESMQNQISLMLEQDKDDEFN